MKQLILSSAETAVTALELIAVLLVGLASIAVVLKVIICAGIVLARVVQLVQPLARSERKEDSHGA